mgnify:CR=1 FL=1
MIDAIVYNSETGSCEKYARLISEATGVPVYSYSQAKALNAKKVMYISWLTAGKVNGLAKAQQELPLAAIVQVGITPVDASTEAKTRKANKIPANTAVFCKQGGLHMSNLAAPYKAAMTLVNKAVYAKLKKKDRDSLDEQERALYGMVTTGEGEPANWDVSDVVAWVKGA